MAVDSVFLLSVVTIGSGIVGLMVRYCFKSKCSDINCLYGCLQIKRDIKSEIELEENQIAHNVTTGSESPRASSSPSMPAFSRQQSI